MSVLLLGWMMSCGNVRDQDLDDEPVRTSIQGVKMQTYRDTRLALHGLCLRLARTTAQWGVGLVETGNAQNLPDGRSEQVNFAIENAFTDFELTASFANFVGMFCSVGLCRLRCLLAVCKTEYV
jgi:hypothetical protein